MKARRIRAGVANMTVVLSFCLCSCGGMAYHLNYNRVEGAAREIVREITGQGPQAGPRASAIPGVEPLKMAMKERNKRLLPFYANGTALEKDDGYLCTGDTRRLPIRDGRVLGGLIAEENSARRELYKAVADHFHMGGDYAADVARIFARQWAGGKK